MNICYISNSAAPSKNASSLQTANLCAELVKQGHKVQLILPNTGLNKNYFKYYGIKNYFKILKLKNLVNFLEVYTIICIQFFQYLHRILKNKIFILLEIILLYLYWFC